MNFKVLALLLGLIIECVLCWNSGEDFVDHTDMGSYSHGVRRNVKPAKIRVPSSPSNSESTPKTELSAGHPEANSLKLGEWSGGVSPPCPCPCPTLDETSVMAHMKRLVASLLTQMNVRSHVFGPGEAITIDLQAEISYEDYKTLNSFISAQDGESAKYFRYVDLIVSELLHLVPSHQSTGVIGSFHEWIHLRIPTVMSFKFWLTLLSLTIVGFIIVMLCLQFANARNQPVVFVAYGILIFFVLSCLWSYAGLQEDKKAQNTARLRQFDTVPDDCNYNSLGVWGSLSYFMRVKVAGYSDRCEEYYKEMERDPFHRSSPIEAISETFSKLIFHPMEYIGERMGKFFSGVISAVPFWIQPFLLILIFVFSFLAIFRYRIRTPFISIEPVPRPRILGSPERVPTNENHAIIERPPAPVVPGNRRDASTSTDDLEAYILQQARESQNSRSLGPPPPSPSLWDWNYIRETLFNSFLTLYALILQFISKILRDGPNLNPRGRGPWLFDPEDFENDFEQIWGHAAPVALNLNPPRPILPDEIPQNNPAQFFEVPAEGPYPFHFPVQMPFPPQPQPVIHDRPPNMPQAGPSSSGSSSNDDPNLQASGFGWVSFEDDVIVIKEMPVSTKARRKEEAEVQRLNGAGDGLPDDIDPSSVVLGFDALLDVDEDAESFYPVSEDHERQRRVSSGSESDDFFNMIGETEEDRRIEDVVVPPGNPM